MPQANVKTRQKKEAIQSLALSGVIKNKNDINNISLFLKKKKKPTLMFLHVAEITH